MCKEWQWEPTTQFVLRPNSQNCSLNSSTLNLSVLGFWLLYTKDPKILTYLGNAQNSGQLFRDPYDTYLIRIVLFWGGLYWVPIFLEITTQSCEGLRISDILAHPHLAAHACSGEYILARLLFMKPPKRVPSPTWTPKVCKIMAFMAIIMGLRLLFYMLLGSR